MLDDVFKILSAAQDALGRRAIYRRRDGGETTLTVAPERFWNGSLGGVYPVAVDRALWSFRADSLDGAPEVGDELDVEFGERVETFRVVKNRDDDRCWTWRDEAARARYLVCSEPVRKR